METVCCAAGSPFFDLLFWKMLASRMNLDVLEFSSQSLKTRDAALVDELEENVLEDNGFEVPPVMQVRF